MKITVTQEHIVKGAKDDCMACPIAYAASQHLSAPMVNKQWLGHKVFSQGGIAKWHKMPQEAIEFVRCFDGGIPVKPFSFSIDCDCPRMDE